MARKCNVPGRLGTPGTQRELSHRSRSPDTPTTWKAQLLCARFHVTGATAETIAALAFVGGAS